MRERITQPKFPGAPGLVFRRASADDCAEVIRLATQLHRLHTAERPDIFADVPPYTREEYLLTLEEQVEEFHVASRPDGRLAAYALLVFRRSADWRGVRGRFLCNIDELCVDETCRRQGIGRAFFAYLEGQARERQAGSLELTVWCFNRPAEDFYRHLGLQPRIEKMEIKL